MKPRWKKNEFSDAEKFQGRRQRGSGNGWKNPGDVKTEDFLIDVKTTDNKSFSVTLSIWEKLRTEALFLFKRPLLSLKIQDKELVVLEKDDFLAILEAKKHRQEQ